jgi:hypothetical protein
MVTIDIAIARIQRQLQSCLTGDGKKLNHISNAKLKFVPHRTPAVSYI